MRALLAIAALALTLAGCASPSPAPAGGPPPASEPAAAVKLIGGEQGNFFQPAQLTVKAGESVTWTDQSGHHTVALQTSINGNGTASDSGDLGPGQSYSLTFPNGGTYNYRCRYHSSDFGAGKGMTGTIVVQ